MAYQRPMVTVDQNMTTTPTSIERDQPALIFGPNYELHRYSDADEKPKTFLGTYENGEDLVDAYPGVMDISKVDTGYTKVIGDDVVVELCKLGTAATPEANIPDGVVTANGGYTKLLFENKKYVDYNKDGGAVERDASLKRNLEVGDYVYVAYTFGGKQGSIVTRIASVEYDGSPWNIDSDSSYEGAAGTMVTLYDGIPAASTGVSASLVGVLQGVEFDKKNDKNTGEKWAWEQGDYGIKINANSLYAADYDYFGNATDKGLVISANIYVTTRELVTQYSDTYHSLTGASSVSGLLGTVDPDNPLAMGVYMAALNSATEDGDEAPPVYFMAVESDDIDGYSKVLKQATLTDRAYVFAPTTQDDSVLELLRSHVISMSTKTVKMWRIAAASAKIPEKEAVVSKDANGHSYMAIPITENDITAGQPATATYNRFMIVKSADNPGSPNDDIDLRSKNMLIEDDVIQFNPHTDEWGEVKWDDYHVRKVISRNIVEVKETISVSAFSEDTVEISGGGSVYAPKRIEAYHELTDGEYAEKVASVSRFFSTRRMINVFPPRFKSNGVEMTGEFAACAVAGLISATEPQQPITNVTVRGIDDVPMVYEKYDNEMLDTMAAGGTFIVAQDLPDDIVYVRHQITTAYPEGNLNTAELSITKNVDSISYAFADVFRPYYGKYNITPELIAILENLAGQLINQFAGSTSVYGPQLIADQTSIKYVRQNALMKDRVDIAITLGVPYPCNNIEIVLTV